jgi:small-conductance mechanosensitive channel
MDMSPFKAAARGAWSACAFALLWWSAALPCLSAPAVAARSTNAPSGAGTNAAPIPLAEVAGEIEASSASLQPIASSISSDPAMAAIEEDLPVISGEITVRLEENSRIIRRNPSLENLRRLEREWHNLREELSKWSRTLAKRVSELEFESERLAGLRQTWEQTESFKAKLPHEVLQRIQSLLVDIKATQNAVGSQRAEVLVLQSRVTEQHTRASQAVNSIERARAEMLQQVFLRDSPPIWSASLWSHWTGELVQETQQSISRQVAALLAFGERSVSRFVVHGAIFLALLGALVWLKNSLEAKGEAPRFQYAALLIEAPVSAALVGSLLISGWMYPQAPRLLWPILGALGLIPATVLLRRLLDPHLIPVLGALIGFYLVDQLRTVAASQALLSRWLFLAEALGGAFFSGWLVRSKRLSRVPEGNRNGLWKTIAFGARVALVTFGFVAVMNSLGYQSLSNLVCNALLASAYLALMFYALARVADSVVLAVLSVPPVGRLAVVDRNRSLLYARACRFVRWVVLILWVISLLDAVALRGLAFRSLKEIWAAKVALGSSFHLTVGDVILFVLTVWAAFLVSAVLRFVLQEEVYPRVQLAPGLYYSISQMLHYAVLLTGFFIGIALLGVNLTKLTILVGAFGVGIGFGLQNIVNNFFSGIILLFERPVKVGDLIQVENTEGVVKTIGIRASIVRTSAGSEIVVPNGNLISNPLTNWTFSQRQRLISIPIAVPADSPVQHVIDVLKQTAAEHPHIVKSPPAEVLMTGFGGGSLNLEVRAWTERFEDWSRIRSDLALAINGALAVEKIAVR